MKKAVPEFVAAKNNLFDYFGCSTEYPVKICTRNEWAVTNNGDLQLLTVLSKGGSRVDYVITKAGGEPIIYATKDYTMVIAVDCIKMAFVLKNINKVN